MSSESDYSVDYYYWQEQQQTVNMTSEHLSLKLYDFLCSLAGSENVVRSRRLFFKTFDSACNSSFINKKSILRSQIHVISSGSKAEGLDFDGSDVDIMCKLKNYPVKVESTDRSNPFEIIVDTSHSSPGFALMKAHNDFSLNLLNLSVHTDIGILLSSDRIKTWFETITLLLKPDGIRFFVKHGPCISRFDLSLDLAPCLHCETWPPFALEWVTRPRSKWPSVDIITEITEQGILFVPIGDSDKPESNPHEWRISFSMAEKVLIHSFNHTQLLCYVLLKFVLKEIIDTNSDCQNLFCSYFMKTVMFWEIETNDCLIWEPHTLFECYTQCLRRLLYFVSGGYCPNYFMPENNLFRNKIFGTAKEKMETLLKDLMSEGIGSLQRSQSLKGFSFYKISRKFEKKEEINGAILSLMNTFSFSLRFCGMDYETLLSSLLMKIRKSNKCKSKLVRELLVLYLARCSGIIAIRMEYDYRLTNKKLYAQKKTCLSHLLIGKTLDNVSGWLKIASFFYQHKEYNNSTIAANYVIAEALNGKILITFLEKIDKKKVAQNAFNLSFLSNHQLVCMHNEGGVVLPFSFLDEGSHFCLNDIVSSETLSNHLVSYVSRPQSFFNRMMNTGGMVGVLAKAFIPRILRAAMKRQNRQNLKMFVQATPVVFGRYLRLLCFHQLHKERQVCQETNDLRTAVEENRSSNIEINVMNYFWLFKAMDLAGDYEQIIPSFFQEIDKIENNHVWFNAMLTSLSNGNHNIQIRSLFTDE